METGKRRGIMDSVFDLLGQDTNRELDMRNVTQEREVTSGDSTLGTVCMKVLIKLLGLIGSCQTRESRGHDRQTRASQGGSGRRVVPCWMHLKAAKGEADRGSRQVSR
jgi:hypothetical protein